MLLIPISTGANAKCYSIQFVGGFAPKKQKENKVAGIVLVTK